MIGLKAIRKTFGSRVISIESRHFPSRILRLARKDTSKNSLEASWIGTIMSDPTRLFVFFIDLRSKSSLIGLLRGLIWLSLDG